MALTLLTMRGNPACEHNEHEGLVYATEIVPVYVDGVIRRWVAVCEMHDRYGDRPADARVIDLMH